MWRKLLLSAVAAGAVIPSGVVIWRKVTNRPIRVAVSEVLSEPLKWAGREVVVEGKVGNVNTFGKWIWYTLEEQKGSGNIKVFTELAPKDGQIVRVKGKVNVPLTIRSRPITIPFLGKAFLVEQERWELVEGGV